MANMAFGSSKRHCPLSLSQLLMSGPLSRVVSKVDHLALTDPQRTFLTEPQGGGPALLTVAVQAGRQDVVDYLLTVDVVQAAVQDRKSPVAQALWHAVDQGRRRMVETLLQHGATPDVAGVAPSPLILAVNRHRTRIVELLLRAGADPTHRVGRLTPSAYEVARASSNEKARRLMVTVSAPVYRATFLRCAAAQGELSQLHEMLHYDCCLIDFPDPRGRTALMEAVRARRRASVTTLIEYGADVNTTDTRGWTALHWAMKVRDARVAAELIVAGADVDARTLDGRTPLIVGAQAGAADGAQLLLESQADARPTYKGRTARRIASRTDGATAAVIPRLDVFRHASAPPAAALGDEDWNGRVPVFA